MDMQKFKSIEEVKEFISSTDAKTFGAISFIDPDTGKSIQLTMNEFIEKVGLDEAAEFIFDNMSKMSKIEASRDDLKNIVEKYKEDPESITDEEMALLSIVANTVNNDNSAISIGRNIMMLMIKGFLDVGQRLTENYSGLLSVLLTVMEESFVLNSDLSVYSDNRAVYDELVKSVTDQIIIPEGIDEASLLIGLFHIIGERYISSDLTKKMKIDYRKFAEAFDLDMDFLFGEKDENSTTNNNSETEEPKNKDNIVNLDIRRKLKEDKK